MPDTLVVFSRWRWDFVCQRPQHLLRELAAHLRVLYVEEPVYGAGAPHLHCQPVEPNVQRLVPYTPLRTGGFHDAQLPVLKPLLQAHLRVRGSRDCAAWFYAPMALPLIAHWHPCQVIYDCIDDPSAHTGAPQQTRQREDALLRAADLVLTAGPSLYEAKRSVHPNVHYLPSGVDAAHFAPRDPAMGGVEAAAAARCMAGVAQPRLGFFGVIDERIDLELLDAVAAARPAWQLVMAGPLARIDPQRLPQRPNIHWLGALPYERLPHLLAQWDVCLMPYALNEATRRISPTKTLEYLAGEKPVVATPVPDLVSLYGDLVRIARCPNEFIAACAAALAENHSQRTERLLRGVPAVHRTSWQEQARVVLRLLSQPAQPGPGSAAAALAAARPPRLRQVAT